ncbi:unnamed protein product, partial [Sphenostylis stenocarpa]
MNGKVAHREVRLGPQIAFVVGLPKVEKGAGVVLAVVGGDCQGVSGAIRLKGKRESEGAGRVGAATRGKRGIQEEWKQGSLGRTVRRVSEGKMKVMKIKVMTQNL